MNKIKFAAVVGIIATLAACGGQKEVSFDTLETARNQVKENVLWNAQVYRGGQPQYANYAIVMQGDSSQLPNCPQGDGWASGKLVSKDDPSKQVNIKCSTVSGSIGCMLQREFDTKPYAADDGHCQEVSKVPFPIPKISK